MRANFEKRSMNSEFKLGDESFSNYSEKHEGIPSNLADDTQ